MATATKGGDARRPDDPVPVVAAVIRGERGVLLARRPPSKRHGGLWEFPGGKVLEGESDRDALERELREELDVELDSVGRILFRIRDPGTPFALRFRSARIRGRPRALEHTEIRWVSRHTLRSLSLAPADARFVEACLSGPDDR